MEAKLFKKTVNENLRQIRESKGLSTAAIANILGVSQAKISYIENNKGILSAADVAILARHLNIPVTEFFRGLSNAGETTGQKLTHQLTRYGAVLLAKTKGIITEVVSFEETFANALGYIEDDRIHKAFLAALIVQAGSQEIHIDQIFSRIGNSPFLVVKTIEEIKTALLIVKQLESNLKFAQKRAQGQLNKILATANEITKTAHWDIKQSTSKDSIEDELPDLVHFVSECLNAKR